MKIDGGMDTSMIEKPMTTPIVKGQSDEDLRKAASDFEAMFTNMVLKEMRETIPDSETWGDSSKVKFFQSMLDDEYSKMSVNKSKNSLSELIYQNLKRQADVGKMKP